MFSSPRTQGKSPPGPGNLVPFPVGGRPRTLAPRLGGGDVVSLPAAGDAWLLRFVAVVEDEGTPGRRAPQWRRAELASYLRGVYVPEGARRLLGSCPGTAEAWARRVPEIVARWIAAGLVEACPPPGNYRNRGWLRLTRAGRAVATRPEGQHDDEQRDDAADLVNDAGADLVRALERAEYAPPGDRAAFLAAAVLLVPAGQIPVLALALRAIAASGVRRGPHLVTP